MIKCNLKKFIHNLVRTRFIRIFYMYFTICRDSNLSFFRFLYARQRNYLFMIAMHNNAGDLAQTVCTDEWLHKNFPNSIAVNVAWTSNDEWFLKAICKTVRPTDRVFIHSGYNITDICDEFASPEVFASHKIILEYCKDHKVVFLPQTVEYKSIEKWQPIKDMYSAHRDIVFISRDLISLKYAKELLPYAKHLAYPDIVTTWIGQYNFDAPGKDVFLCFRSGAEALMTEEDKHIIETTLKSNYKSIGIGDTDINRSAFYYRGNRKDAVLQKIKEFSQYKVIITDRYHGTIFSLIAGRPVIVIKTAGHKVESAISWFPEEFDKYIYFIDDPHNTEKIIKLTNELLNKDIVPLKSNYFNEIIYNKLKEEIS